ncbi:MAG: hypothetical protein JWQ40_3114 [Segetibacter sp.]|jgi:hypothetical protein|nr:hypothetical protein [Segetibacter sp.]
MHKNLWMKVLRPFGFAQGKLLPISIGSNDAPPITNAGNKKDRTLSNHL